MNFLSPGEIQGLVNTLAGVSNARLREIRDTPAMDTSGRKTAQGALLWQGASGLPRPRANRPTCSAARHRATTRSSPASKPSSTDTFTILDAAGAPLLERPGSEWEGTTITVEDFRTTPVDDVDVAREARCATTRTARSTASRWSSSSP
jgi:hypothetical protein